ncbi:hypothetical protein [Haloarcula salina]|uniref:DUF7965 domain-containing protein n=1 Tax=Haloarcula salina TaxID=1429914 RepID=A0AA41GB94_9EURY|nr:hypothetical protein [Haloarcula salina]MBV0903592.1 hypothetical protein [Haloarcula salina]
MGESEGRQSSPPPETPAESPAVTAVLGGRLSLSTWALATFDVGLFVLVAVLAGHASGALSDLLGGLNTLVGAAVFCVVWALFVLAVWWVDSRVELSASLWTLALHGFAAGAMAGVAFLLGLVAVLAVPALAEGLALGTATLSAVAGVALFLLVGVAVASLIGGAIGLLVGVLDGLCFRLADRVLAASAGDR